jgi:uncharacterized membrane protein
MGREEKLRPAVITAVCVWGFLGVGGGVMQQFSAFVKSAGAWFQIYFALNTALTLIASIGLWKMKRWGALLYIGLTIIYQVAIWRTGAIPTHILALAAVVSGAVIVLVISQYRKMK